jgi:hypothetical protein
MDLLDSAHTWFLDSITFYAYGELCVELVEGIKGSKKEPVKVNDTVTMGPYFPVRVSESSRVISILFRNVLIYEVQNKSLDVGDEKLEKGRRNLSRCSNSGYLEYVKNGTSLSYSSESYLHFFLWTEDYLIKIISEDEPTVVQLKRKPNLEIERTETYAAE